MEPSGAGGGGKKLLTRLARAKRDGGARRRSALTTSPDMSKQPQGERRAWCGVEGEKQKARREERVAAAGRGLSEPKMVPGKRLYLFGTNDAYLFAATCKSLRRILEHYQPGPPVRITKCERIFFAETSRFDCSSQLSLHGDCPSKGNLCGSCYLFPRKHEEGCEFEIVNSFGIKLLAGHDVVCYT